MSDPNVCSAAVQQLSCFTVIALRLWGGEAKSRSGAASWKPHSLFQNRPT